MFQQIVTWQVDMHIDEASEIEQANVWNTNFFKVIIAEWHIQ